MLPSLGFVVDAVDPSVGRISAHSGAGLRSWGSQLEIAVSARSADATRVDVTSSPTWPLTLTDWGKTKSDLAKIGRLIATGRYG